MGDLGGLWQAGRAGGEYVKSGRIEGRRGVFAGSERLSGGLREERTERTILHARTQQPVLGRRLELCTKRFQRRRKLRTRDESIQGFMEDKIFDPLDIDVDKWVSDRSGNPLIHSGLFLSAEQWAKALRGR